LIGHDDDDKNDLTRKLIDMFKVNTTLTEEQIYDWHAGVLSNCPNGKLTNEQFVTFYEQLHPDDKAKDKAKQICKRVFAKFDHDNIGTINIDDFMVAYGLIQSKNRPLRFALAFDVHASNNYTDTMDIDGASKAISTLFDLTGETDCKDHRDPKHCAEELIRNSHVDKLNTWTRSDFIQLCSNSKMLCGLLDRHMV